MLSLVRRLLVVGAAMLAAASPAFAAHELTDSQKKLAITWATHNALFVLYHEVSHLLVDQLRLPVLGKEEDAADAMASYTLLEQHTHETDVAIADAAYGWLLSSKIYGTDLDDSDFYNPHSLDKQRAFQIVCFMVGSDEKSFRSIADDYNIDRERQDGCGYDYELLKRSMDSVLGTYWRKAKKGVNIKITYNSASGNLKPAADAFKESGLFERIADDIKGKYSLRNTVSFRAKRCGEPNAFYDPEAIEVIFCYELMDDFLSMIADDMPAATVPAAPTGFGRADAQEGF